MKTSTTIRSGLIESFVPLAAQLKSSRRTGLSKADFAIGQKSFEQWAMKLRTKSKALSPRKTLDSPIKYVAAKWVEVPPLPDGPS
jgi:hypothetical protein